MNERKKIIGCVAVSLLLLGVTGCYYPAYRPYPAYPPYGYVPQPQAYPAAGNNQECRKYNVPAIIEGKKQQLSGMACRQPDGVWKDANNGAEVHEPPVPKNNTGTPPPPYQGYGYPPSSYR